MTNWKQPLEEIAAMERAVKARSMVYDVSAKEDAARAFGKPLDFYYHFSYGAWEVVSRALHTKRKHVEQKCLDAGIPGDMPWSQFPLYRQLMGLDN